MKRPDSGCHVRACRTFYTRLTLCSETSGPTGDGYSLPQVDLYGSGANAHTLTNLVAATLLIALQFVEQRVLNTATAFKRAACPRREFLISLERGTDCQPHPIWEPQETLLYSSLRNRRVGGSPMQADEKQLHFT